MPSCKAFDPLEAENGADEDGDSESEHEQSDARDETAAVTQTQSSIDFETLAKHGFSSDRSLLQIPEEPSKPEKRNQEANWQWSTERSYTRNAAGRRAELDAARATANERTEGAARNAVADAEGARAARQACKGSPQERKAEKLTYNQREKRKRKRGALQSDFVQEEKRAAKHLGAMNPGLDK